MMRAPRIAAVGLASWDWLLTVQRYPIAGDFAYVDEVSSQPGGTTTNSAVALAKLGARVAFAGMVGDDEYGEQLRDGLRDAGIDTKWVQTRSGERTDSTYIVVSQEPRDRTIFWPPGAHLVKGDLLDVPAIFAHDLVLLDVDDMPLRRFLSDLPAHTLPATRLLGTLVYSAEPEHADRLEVMLRHDAIVGNEREAMLLTETATLDQAIAVLQTGMIGANLRAAVISRGENGATAITARERWDLPAERVVAIDTTGAGDAFTAGVAYGMALRWPWPKTLRLANAMGGLATRALGAQASLPDWPEIYALTGELESFWHE
jgi:ribokinase